MCVLVATLATAAFVPALSAGAPAAQPTGVKAASFLEGELMATLNSFRRARGLRAFRSSPRLRAAAVRHSGEMARWGYFEHASPNGAAFWRRISVYYRETGYRRWMVGENLEYGQPGLEALEVLQDWLASPPHRANVVSRRFRDAGIGVVFVGSGSGVFGGMPTTIVTLDVGFREH
jgi:uncharacterized protein YkwD